MAAEPEPKVYRIITRSVLVRKTPSLEAPPFYQLLEGVIAKYLDTCVDDTGLQWLRLAHGWLPTRTIAGSPSCEACELAEAQELWKKEAASSSRISTKVAQVLAKGYSLTRARRLSKSLCELADKVVDTGKKLMESSPGPVDVLIAILDTMPRLTIKQALGILVVVAVAQSDPCTALLSMAKEIQELLALRPSLWMVNGTPIMETTELRTRTDQFVAAAALGDVEAVKQAIAAGQELSAMHSELQYSAIHAAADFGHDDVIRVLLEHAVSPDTQDRRMGRTPLHYAAQSGRMAVCATLLQAGADRMRTCYAGTLPWMLAYAEGHEACAKMLKLPPPKVDRIKATACGERTITLEWDPPTVYPEIHADIEGYRLVHRRLEDALNTAWRPDMSGIECSECYVAAPQCSATLTNLTPAMGQGFTVFVKSIAGWSEPSTECIAFTTPAPPEPPSKPEVATCLESALLLMWDPPSDHNGSDVERYEIAATACNATCEQTTLAELLAKRDVLCEEATRTVGIDATGVTEFLLPDLTTGVPYFVRVRAKNKCGWGPYSEVGGPYVPQQPLHVVEVTPRSVHLRWIMPVTSRHVQAFELQSWSPSGATVKKISYRKADTRRSNLGGSMLQLASAVSEAAKSPSSLPGALVAGRRPSMAMDDADDSGNNRFTTVAADILTTSYTVTGLTPGRRYQFRIRARVDGLWQGWHTALISPLIRTHIDVPDPPTDLRLASDADDATTEDSITIEWTPSVANGSPLTGTEVHMRLHVDKEDSWKDVTTAGLLTGMHKFCISGLAPRANYCFRVRQSNAAGFSAFSETSPAFATKPIVAPEQPHVVQVLANSVLVRWRHPGSMQVRDVQVQLRVEDAHSPRVWEDASTTKQQPGSVSEEIQVIHLCAGTAYRFRLRVDTSLGWSAYSHPSEPVTTLQNS